MQTYQSTPDYYRDYIEHGWLRDQAAKAHKYIKRWRNKAGKWVYQYKKTGDFTDRSKSLSKGIMSNSDRESSIARYHINKDRNKDFYGQRPIKQVTAARQNAKAKAKKSNAMYRDPRYKKSKKRRAK